MAINPAIQTSYLLKEREYWLDKLKGEIPQAGLPLDFPWDRSRPAVTQSIDFALDADVVDKVLKASRNNDSLLFAILVAALKICLAKYTGTADIVVGSAIHERHKSAAFPNRVLLLRDRVESDMTVRQLLGHVRQTLSEAYANQRYPVEKLHHSPDGSEPSQPLFRSAIVLETIHDLNAVTDQGQDFTLHFSGPDSNLKATLYFDAARLRAHTCEQFAEHYRHVLREMLVHPDEPIVQIHLWSEERKRQLLEQRNCSRRAYPREATITALFTEQADLRPTAIAVSYEDRVLTYGELNRASNRLASRLQKKGAGPEVRIGVCIDRSLEMIIALLGILKSGAAYVPLDPGHTPVRQQQIVKDSGVLLIVTADATAQPQFAGVEVVDLKSEAGALDQEADINPENRATAENLAYVMFTSGSTGVPKGVSIPHRGIVRLVKEANYVELGPGEKILQFAPLTFDASTFEIWGSLLTGGELVVMTSGTPSLESLGAAIRKSAITTMWLTAGLFQLMVDHRLSDLQGVKQLLVGGDVVPAPQAQHYLRSKPGSTLIDGYGPTENTTFSCCHVVRSGTEMGTSIPIGTPVSNTQVYIVDCEFDPVPTGVVGELYAGGDGLARGYVNSPDLTAEKFVPNPFSGTPGERLYRTGDLARYRWDGAIEFIGRADQQVKIRGFRVEPGEIEAVLCQHEGVRTSVVVVEERDGQKDLKACVVVNGQLTRRELRKYLEEKLPSFMVPTILVKTSELPLTPNGKVDRVRLAELDVDTSDGEGEESYVAPRNKTEETISHIWEEVLGVDRAGIFDNFFDLGGHSLLAMKACTKMSEKLACEATVIDLFRNPTVESLARYLSEKCRTTAAQPTPYEGVDA